MIAARGEAISFFFTQNSRTSRMPFGRLPYTNFEFAEAVFDAFSVNSKSEQKESIENNLLFCEFCVKINI